MTGALGFGLAIALGACLLFQIQFLLGKLVLPWFGGAPAVWSTSLVVFQTLLLAGYAYAHALTRLPTRRAQLRRHVALVAVAVGALAWHAVTWPSPVTPDDAWKPDPDASPVMQIVWLLTGAIGVPFVLLASTSPLLQRWHADAFPDRSPYRLYALSNLGSLVGLLSYPLLIEPRLDLFAQGRWWTAGYLAFATLLLASMAQVRRVPVAATRDEAQAEAVPTTAEHVQWLLLAAMPSALLQATTTRITLDVGSMPFLWMVPLALYLLTFVLAFEYPRFYHRHLLAVAVAGIAIAGAFEWSARVTLALTLGTLTLAGLALHGELATRAPAPRWLTRFFLVVSAGGVLGSAIVAFGAPVAFNAVLEYPLTVAAVAATLAIVYLAAHADELRRRGLLRTAGGAFVLLALFLAGKESLGWLALTEDDVFASRNFFGAVRVREDTTEDGQRQRRLQHGTTLHGFQYLEGEKARQPVSYYTPDSGIGQAVGGLSALGRAARIGVVGLGTGTMAAHGRPGDEMTFFEIDPQVVALSTAPTPLFTYLRDSDATIRIVGGDARLSLERAQPSRFDLLVLDAFSSDAVPVHLLTREAIGLYGRHLRDQRSLLAIHVSNRFLELEGVVHAAAAANGFAVVIVEHDVTDDDTERTTWMLLAREAEALRAFGEPLEGPGGPLWTDTSSNLLSVLRRE